MTDYTWLAEYQRTWEEVKVSQELPSEEKSVSSNLRPLLRRMILILDYSKSCTKRDFKPSRHKLISKISSNFEDLFYSYNPLSRLQIIICKNGTALCTTTRSELFKAAEGEFSIQNSFELALKLLEDTGPHWSNEILLILNSLSTCDPENVWESLVPLIENHVRVHVISTCGQSSTLLEFTKQTRGKWIIAENEIKLREKWEEFAKTGYPANSAALIPMAFSCPSCVKSPCACHLQMVDGFLCRVCGGKVCKLPSQCPICKFVLVSAPHLTKASLSMAPLPNFDEGEGECFGCEGVGSKKCKNCGSLYCEKCHEFLKAALGKCIGCFF